MMNRILIIMSACAFPAQAIRMDCSDEPTRPVIEDMEINTEINTQINTLLDGLFHAVKAGDKGTFASLFESLGNSWFNPKIMTGEQRDSIKLYLAKLITSADSDLCDRITIVQPLGQGAAGSVYKAKIHGEVCAVKVWFDLREESKERAEKEVYIANLLSEKDLACAPGRYELIENKLFPMVRMPFLEGQTLSNWTYVGARHSLADRKDMILQVADAMKEMQEIGMCHRDAGDRNWMVVDGKLKVIDFDKDILKNSHVPRCQTSHAWSYECCAIVLHYAILMGAVGRPQLKSVGNNLASVFAIENNSVDDELKNGRVPNWDAIKKLVDDAMQDRMIDAAKDRQGGVGCEDKTQGAAEEPQPPSQQGTTSHIAEQPTAVVPAKCTYTVKRIFSRRQGSIRTFYEIRPSNGKIPKIMPQTEFLRQLELLTGKKKTRIPYCYRAATERVAQQIKQELEARPDLFDQLEAQF